jgi:uncharacterized protein YidB (DUF937 family)
MGLMDVLKGMQYGPHGAPRTGTGSGTGTGTGSSAGTGTGMSPITMAILGLLAYKALKHVTHYTEVPADGPSPDRGSGSAAGGRIGTARSQGTAPSPTSSDTDADMAPRDSDMGRGWPGDLMPGGRPATGGAQSGTTTQQTGGTQTSAHGSLSDLIKGALGSLLAGSAAGGVMSGGLNDLLKQMERQGFTDTAESWVGGGPNKTIPPGDLAKVLGADQIEAMMAQSGLSREELLDGLSKHLPEVVDRLTPDGQVPHHIPM